MNNSEKLRKYIDDYKKRFANGGVIKNPTQPIGTYGCTGLGVIATRPTHEECMRRQLVGASRNAFDNIGINYE